MKRDPLLEHEQMFFFLQNQYISPSFMKSPLQPLKSKLLQTIRNLFIRPSLQ